MLCRCCTAGCLRTCAASNLLSYSAVCEYACGQRFLNCTVAYRYNGISHLAWAIYAALVTMTACEPQCRTCCCLLHCLGEVWLNDRACAPQTIKQGPNKGAKVPREMDIYDLEHSFKPERWLDPATTPTVRAQPCTAGHA